VDLFIYPYLLIFNGFFFTWCCNLERMPEFIGSRFN